MVYKTVEEAITNSLPKGEDYIAFSSNADCEDCCDGWDGVSKRCECGSQRVEWDIKKDATGAFSVHPVACNYYQNSKHIYLIATVAGYNIYCDSEGYWNILPIGQECTQCGYRYLSEIAKLKGL